MKKSTLAGVQYRLDQLEQIHENNLEKFLDIISGAFSALATAEPSYALEALNQLKDQEKRIAALAKERESQQKEYVSAATAGMADFIEFEDED
jgi:hypothetical protein